MEERVRQLTFFWSRRLYLARQKRTTFEARDRPYVTILKSVPSHPWIIDPTPEVSAPRVRKNEWGASLYIDEVAIGNDSHRQPAINLNHLAGDVTRVV